MLRIALLELKFKKRWGRRFFFTLIVLSVFAVIVSVYSLSSGVRIDRGIYSANIELDDPKFVVAENPDIYVQDGRVFVKGDLKSLSAFDEFRNYIRKIYNDWIYEKFGSSAFPILIRVVKVPTKTEFNISAKNLKIETVKKREVKPKPEGKRKEERKRITTGIPKKIENLTERRVVTKSDFITPDELRPPSLLSKIIYAFGFVIPIYFVVQVYSSSAIEDKIKRRLEVLFVAEDEWKVLLGKTLPYLIVSLALAFVTVATLGKNVFGVVFLIPIVLFLLSLSTFTSMMARSYKEMTFLTIIISIFVTTYLFIPAIFTAIPVSRISPITLLIELTEGESVSVRDYVVSTFQFYVMSAVLFYLSLNSIEIMHSQSNPIEKVFEITKRVVRSYKSVFLASLLSIPFVFFIEFFTLSLIFAFKYAFFILILLVAVIEELFKGTFIYSAFRNGLNPYLSALLSALGFLIGEKTILFSFVPLKFAEFLVFPFVAHVLAAFLFVLTLRFGFTRALIVASSFHAIYDGVVLCLA